MRPAAAPAVVLLVRHAHADWPLYSGRDFDRPLTPRGEELAAATACAIRSADLAPTLILASPARRTRQTADIIAAVLGLGAGRQRYIDALYNAKPETLEVELRRVARAGSTILLVAHNPGISQLARAMSGDAQRPPFDPAGWACLAMPTSRD